MDLADVDQFFQSVFSEPKCLSGMYPCSTKMKEVWHSVRMSLGFCPAEPRNWKWPNGVGNSEMSIILCIYITNNVKTCKKINISAQTTNFIVFSKELRLATFNFWVLPDRILNSSWHCVLSVRLNELRSYLPGLKMILYFMAPSDGKIYNQCK